MKGEGKGFLWYLLLVVLAAAAAACLVAPAIASATTRYAAPGGAATPAECITPDSPCTIFDAAQGTGVIAGDDVVIAPGNYADTAGDLGPSNYVDPVANTVHGAVGQPRPVITLHTDANSAFGAFKVEAGNTISHIEVDTSESQTNIGLTGGVVDDLIARSSNTLGPIVCRFTGTATLRDSACISSGDQGRSVGSFFGAVGTQTATLRNVTAVATGPNSNGINFAATTSGQTLNVDAKSVIARSMGTFGTDVYGQEFNGAETVISLDHSNFGGSGGQGTPTISSPFANNNQISSPVLASDSIHQVTNSPTVNAGAALDGSSGTVDIDGQSRNIGGTPDIGADELGNPTTTTVGCNPEPVPVGSTTTCTATVTDPVMGNPTPTGSVSFSSDVPGGSFGSGGTCALAPLTMGQSSCQVTYSAGSGGSTTHGISAVYGGGTIHDGSVDEVSILFGVFLTSPPPPAFQGSAPYIDPCPPLRKKLRKAKKANNKAKVRKLRRKLRRLGC
jgi:hypothetical protein